jgi:hypothetical protein
VRQVQHVVHQGLEGHPLLLEDETLLAQRGCVHDVVDERQQAGAAGADDVHLAAHAARQCAAAT